MYLSGCIPHRYAHVTYLSVLRIHSHTRTHIRIIHLSQTERQRLTKVLLLACIGRMLLSGWCAWLNWLRGRMSYLSTLTATATATATAAKTVKKVVRNRSIWPINHTFCSSVLGYAHGNEINVCIYVACLDCSRSNKYRKENVLQNTNIILQRISLGFSFKIKCNL